MSLGYKGNRIKDQNCKVITFGELSLITLIGKLINATVKRKKKLNLKMKVKMKYYLKDQHFIPIS